MDAANSPEGIVEIVHGGNATVRVPRTTCPRCAAGQGCGAGIFAGQGGDVSMTAALPPDTSVRVGDRVTLTLQPGGLLRAAANAYGLPLAGLVLAAGLARALDGAEVESVVWGLCGMLGGFMVARRRRDRCLSSLQPRIRGLSSPGPDA